MKRKSFFAILAIATMLILSLTVLTGCKGKKHDFSGEWLSDDTNHWHACTTKKHTDVADVAEHTFDAGVVTTAPTETAEGVLTLTCTVCKHQKTKVLAKVAHVHKFNESVWEKDDTHHWHPATCAHTDQKSAFENHVWNEGVITTPATETTEGEKTYTCTKCEQTKTSSIGKLDHVHTFDTENWDFDSENHWHPATCGHADEKNALAPHTWNEGVITTPATETTEGIKTYTCTKCGNTKTSSIGKLDHVHTFDTENWAFDTENHWHPATCGHADEKNASAPHAWNDGVITKPADYGVAGEKTYTCNVCRTTKTEAIKALDAKDNVISFADGVELSKTYDGTPVEHDIAKINRYGDGEITVTYKLKAADDSAYNATAPKSVGEYTLKVSVEGTAEWKAASKTFDFAITPVAITVDLDKEYDNSNILTGEPVELIAGEEAIVTVTMDSANVGAKIQKVELTGKDAGNYSLAQEDVTAKIIKADVDFKISNAAAFTEFFVGATNIPEPTTNYVEIGTGYGEKTIVWEKQVDVKDNIWGPIVAGIDRVRERAGNYRVRIQYAEGDNYNFGKTEYVYFTMKVKPRSLTVKNFAGKTYDGKQVTNFTYDALEDIVGVTDIPGVSDLTSPYDGEQYVEFREVGGEWGRNMNAANVLTNAGVHEYRIGIAATEEWAEAVSVVKTFTIKPYEFVLELGYGQNQNNQSYDRGKTFVLRQYDNLIEGQKIQLWLDNEKAGFNTKEGNNSVYYFIPDQKKQVTTDCFFLKIENIMNPNMKNYRIVPKYSYISTVEITVVEHNPIAIGKSGSITNVSFTATETWLVTTVTKGYFKVGHTVEIYNRVGTKVGEATIIKIEVEVTNTSSFSNSPSGFAIPSDGKVRITLDKVFKDSATGSYIPLMEGYIKTK